MVSSKNKVAEHLEGLKEGDVVTVIHKETGRLVAYGFIKATTSLGWVVTGITNQPGDHFFDFTGSSHTVNQQLRKATEEEAIIHKIKQTSGRVFLLLGIERLRELHAELNSVKDKP